MLPLRTPFFRALALCLPSALGGAASAQDIGSGIQSYQAGVICPSTGGDLASLPFVARTLVVPAVPGMAFGVRALTTQALGPVRAQLTLSHPSMGATGATQQTFDLTLSPTQLSGFHYRFDTADELVPGLWRMQAQAGGVVLFTIEFDVVAPAANDGLLRACGS